MSVCPAIPEEAAASDCDEVFVIVHTNDVHGYIEVEPYVKAVADEMRAEYGNSNVITVSAGDVFSGGNAVAHLYNGETIPPIMDAAGYDALVPGNNDFNSTMEDAAAAMGEYLGSGGVVILPDVPLPDHRIVPMDEMPAGVITYSVTVDTEKVP